MKIFVKQSLAQILKSRGYKTLYGIIKRNQILALALLIGTVFVDSLFITTSSDIVIFGVLLLYIIIANIVQMNSRVTFYLCLGLVCGVGISFLFSQASVPTEKLTVWFVLFMVTGIIQQWRE
ncbi:hypothetical protein HY409_01280 [Candidatus Gottesmanbacteria bacterium]|nr:hypothetical protein [Candidatus Gottesmanbacteria bacterium]